MALFKVFCLIVGLILVLVFVVNLLSEFDQWIYVYETQVYARTHALTRARTGTRAHANTVHTLVNNL